MTVRLESVTFTSGDRATRVPSYLATPDRDGPHPVVLILRGVAGPDDGYTEIARRLAEWGYVALVHGWKVRGADPTDEPVYSDLQGAMSFLGSVGQADLKRLAVFGFCRGGVHALMAARAHAEIRVIVVFHGFAFRPVGAQPGAEPYDLAGGVNVPMLVLHGTEDERAPMADMRRMEARMRAFGKVYLHLRVLRRRPPRLCRAHPPRLCRGCGEAELRRGQTLPGKIPARYSIGLTTVRADARVRGDGHEWRPTDDSRSG